MIRKCIFFVVLFSALTSLKSQVFNVGDLSCNHKSVNFTFTYTPFAGIKDSLKIDLDGDLVSDIKFQALKMNSSPYWFNDDFFNITTLNPSTYISMTSIVCNTLNLLKTDTLGTPITSTLNWQQGTGTVFQSWWNGIGSSSANQWCGILIGDFYISFKKNLTTDTVYGWIKARMGYNLPLGTGPTIYDFSFKGTSYCTGINDKSRSKQQITVYPNPSNDQFTIIGIFEGESIEIFNVLGQNINVSFTYSSEGLKFELRDQSKGVYFLRIGTSSVKIVKE